MGKQHFRGVVWPRKGPVDGTYQYVIAAIVVTDRPIPVGTSQGYLDGGVTELFLDELQRLGAFKPAAVFGDATDVLTRLGKVNPREDAPIANDGDEMAGKQRVEGTTNTRKRKT